MWFMFNLVKRERAPRYIFIVVISFAISIIGIRLYLFLLNYPKLGGGGWHIAHVLWGGILLTIGACLTLIFSNAKAYYVSSVLVGFGMGFFFDEVGKFLTETNDYFFQMAAPIIYSVFLLTFFVYLYLRKPRQLTQRELFYQVLDDCKEILDEDLDPDEKKEIQNKLIAITKLKGNEDIQQFSKHLYHYLSQVKEDQVITPVVLHQNWHRVKQIIRDMTWVHVWFFWGIIGLLVIRAINSIVNLIFAWFYLLEIDRWYSQSIERLVGDLIINQPLELTFLLMQTIAEGLVGLVFIWAIWLRLKNGKGGLNLIRFALLFSIVSIDVIAFYFEQFSHVISILVDVILIMFLDFYGKIYDEEKL